MLTALKKIRSWLCRAKAIVTISVDDERVSLGLGNGKATYCFTWAEVDEIETFKRDCFVIDDIRLAFSVDDRWYEFSESDIGFQPLAEMMRTKFPSIPPDWFGEVMVPAFATNRRTLWKRG